MRQSHAIESRGVPDYDAVEEPHVLRQLYHDGLAQASYLIGCQATGEAIVIDPNRNIEQYFEYT